MKMNNVGKGFIDQNEFEKQLQSLNKLRSDLDNVIERLDTLEKQHNAQKLTKMIMDRLKKRV